MAKAKKEQTTEDIRALSAIEIAVKLRTITEAIIEAGGECNDETMAALQNWQAVLEMQFLSIVETLKEAE